MSDSCLSNDSGAVVITPPAQYERGKVIGVGVHVYNYIYAIMFVDPKKIESYFSNRLTFSNIRGRTSRLI